MLLSVEHLLGFTEFCIGEVSGTNTDWLPSLQAAHPCGCLLVQTLKTPYTKNGAFTACL